MMNWMPVPLINSSNSMLFSGSHQSFFALPPSSKMQDIYFCDTMCAVHPLTVIIISQNISIYIGEQNKILFIFKQPVGIYVV